MRLRSTLVAALPFVLGTAIVSCSGGDSPTGTSAATVVMMLSGNDQEATVGTTIPDSLAVIAFDAKGQPASGVAVSWSVVQGSGTITPATSTTSVLGEAKVAVRIGNTPGAVRVTAVVGSLPPVLFTLTGLQRAPAQLIVVSGESQTGTVNTTVTNPLIARVLDATGAPYAGAIVLFSPMNGGQATPASVTTNANGEASTSWRLGTAAGAQTLTASSSGVPTLTFHATATAGAPTQLTIASGNNQTSTVGQKLMSPVVMLVRDAWDNPVTGTSVAFAVTAGGGSLAPTSVVTGADGRASAEWTLGPTIGTNSGTATVTGIGNAVLTATATPPINSLAHRVVDAEHNLATNRIITVSANPSRLHIIDPETQGEQTVDLPQVPTSVAVQPNGLFAAVGHNGFISYVNLTTRVVDRVYPVTTNVIDIVLPGNGWIYAFPRTDQWETIRSIALSTGAETLTGTIRAGTLVRLHPSGKYIYGANNGLSPSDFEKYGIGTTAAAGTAATYLYDSPYHGDYAFNGNVWVSEDGLRLFAKSGNAFRSSEVRAEDILYAGSLQGMTAVQWVVQSTAAGKIFALPGATFNAEAASELRVYDSAVLAYRGASVLPRFNIPTVGSYASRGRFAFTRADGARVYVLIQADGAAGLAQDWGLVVYPVAELP